MRYIYNVTDLSVFDSHLRGPEVGLFRALLGETWTGESELIVGKHRIVLDVVPSGWVPFPSLEVDSQP